MRSRKASMEIKRKIHDECILPVMTYGCETRALNNAMMDTLAVAQRQMERTMLGITLRDRKRNTWIRQETGVSDIIKAIRKAKHRWAGQTARLSEQHSGFQEIGPENRVVRKKKERRSHQADRTLMIKISQAQTLVRSIQAGVPLSRG